jgi:hypothetical protein
VNLLGAALAFVGVSYGLAFIAGVALRDQFVRMVRTDRRKVAKLARKAEREL